MEKQKLTVGFASYRLEVSNKINFMPFSGVLKQMVTDRIDSDTKRVRAMYANEAYAQLGMV